MGRALSLLPTRSTFRAPAAGGGGGAGSGPAPEPASFAVPPGGKVTLKIKLSKKNFRILKRNHKVRVRVTVTLENLAGTTSKASKKITLKAPKRRR